MDQQKRRYTDREFRTNPRPLLQHPIARGPLAPLSGWTSGGV